jgi:fumarate hydratase subunit beta
MKVELPLNDEKVEKLRSGETVLLTGTMYVGRDSAHKKLVEAMDRGENLPLELKGATIYYMGPSPARPGQAIGSAGPTTSGRMDSYTPRLLEAGLKGMIGKGTRTQAVKDSIRANRGVYFAAIGGAGALISKAIKKSKVIAYGELGPEALLEVYVEDFPAVVVNDMHGGDLYLFAKEKYRTHSQA